MRPRAANEWSTRLTAGRLAPTIAARSDCDRPLSKHDAVERLGSFVSGETKEQLREAASEVEEREVACLLGEAPDQLPEAAQHRVENDRVPHHDVENGRAGQEKARRRFHGDDRRRAGGPVQKRDLARRPHRLRG